MIYYTKNHQWLKEDGDGIFLFGLTTFAIEELGEVVFVDFLKSAGESAEEQTALAEVESLKSVDYFLSPTQLCIVECNTLFAKEQFSLINEDPIGRGWLFRVIIEDRTKLSTLLSEEDYNEYIG